MRGRKETDDDIKERFTFDVEWDVFDDDGGGDDLVVWVDGGVEMCERGGAASGGKVRVVVWRERATVGGVAVEPLLRGSEQDSGGTEDTYGGQGAACGRLWLCVGRLLEALGGGKVELAVEAFALVIVRVVKTLLRRPRVQSQRRDVWRRARHDIGKRKRQFQNPLATPPLYQSRCLQTCNLHSPRSSRPLQQRIHVHAHRDASRMVPGPPRNRRLLRRHRRPHPHPLFPCRFHRPVERRTGHARHPVLWYAASHMSTHITLSCSFTCLRAGPGVSRSDDGGDRRVITLPTPSISTDATACHRPTYM